MGRTLGDDGLKDRSDPCGFDDRGLAQTFYIKVVGNRSNRLDLNAIKDVNIVTNQSFEFDL